MNRASAYAGNRSQVAFAAILLVLGITGLVRGDFAPVWDPAPAGIPERTVQVYLTALVFVGSGVALLVARAEAWAAGLLLGSLCVWMLAFRVPVILSAPGVEVAWESCGEIAVMVAGAWVVFAQRASDAAGAPRMFTGRTGIRIGRVIFGLALIPLGLAHLVYLKETASLVPAWLPAHEAWARLTGAFYLAAGVAVLTGVWAPRAAILTALQMAGFIALVWLPQVASGAARWDQWSEFLLSAALSSAAWVVADSYRSR